MPSRFTFIAMAMAAPLWLAACEQDAQQEAETGEAEVPQIAETQTAEPAEPTQPPAAGTQTAQPAAPEADEPPDMAEQQPPAAGDSTGQPAPEAQGQAADGEGTVVVVPPEEDAAGEEQRAAQSEDRRPAAQAPGEPAPEASGVASVAAYIGRWAQEERMCRQSYWIFTNLRLLTPGDVECDIRSTEEQQDGVSLEVACADEDDPLAEPRLGTMSLTFPNLPQTDTMAVTGGPAAEEARTLSRCPLG